MSASWGVRSGLRVVACGTAGPGDLEGAGDAGEFDSGDAYRALLGDGWRGELEARAWSVDHVERTHGVRRRRWCAPPGSGAPARTEDLAAVAARRANAGQPPPQLLLLATSTPRRVSASAAASVAAILGWNCAAMDVRAGGAGALAAWALAAQALGPGCERALVVGAECMSAYLDPGQLTHCLLFGDGAGALLLEYAPGYAGGLQLADVGRASAGGTPFTVPGDPTDEGGGGGRYFGAPDGEYRRCLATARRANVQALGQRLESDPDIFLPYAVTSAQVAEDAQLLGVGEDSVSTTLAAQGCIGAAGCLSALHELGAQAGQTLAFTAAGGGISTARLSWLV